ncbi:MAG: flagellar hook-associated protein FlgK [Acidobacteriia bacterium]|nr:flagellar hook-associated protein FlgK [Terriglobia bacterium]
MANLLALLGQTANALGAFDQVLEVTQNNVANASSPGYASQSMQLNAQGFQPPDLLGGVKAGEMQSSRDEYAEQTLRQQTTGLGQQQQAVTNYTSLQNIFNISGNTGIPYALNNFFQSVSAWGQAPNDQNARQQVLAQATNVAQAFNQTASHLQQLSQQTYTQTQSTVQQVNEIVGQIQAFNQTIINSGSAAANDPGVDANVHAALDSLSSLINFSATKQANGTTTILLNGNTPLLVGAQQYSLGANLVYPSSPPAIYTNAPPETQIVASDGTDVTADCSAGQLGALLQMNNSVLPSIQGGPSQEGSLNQMAQGFADTVNQLLTSGNISEGPPPQPGVPLFTYSATNSDGSANPTFAASTLAVDPSVTPDKLAAINPGPPEVSNGIPLALANLANPTSAAEEINGVSYTQFYGNIATSVGYQLQSAQNGVQVQQSLVAQAQNQIQQVSGVDINQQAMIAVEFQRAYEANSQLITVLNQLTQDTLNLLGTP